MPSKSHSFKNVWGEKVCVCDTGGGGVQSTEEGGIKVYLFMRMS